MEVIFLYLLVYPSVLDSVKAIPNRVGYRLFPW